MDILIVTSAADFGRLLRDGMEADGHAARLANTGSVASVELLARVPELTLIDLELADVGGGEVLKALRSSPGGTDVSVIVFAVDADRARVVTQAYSPDHVLAKPVSLLDLADLVRQVALRRDDRPSRAPVAHARPPRAPTAAPAASYPPAGTPPARPAPSVAAIAAARDPSVLRTRGAAGIRPPPPPAPESAEDIARLVVRLRRDVKVTENADPWTVLGLPARSSPEMVAQTIERLRARYLALEESPSEEVRALARQLLDRVDDALDDLPRNPDAGPSAEVAEGVALLDAERWAEAEAWFSAARDRNPDSAQHLAHLGWARYHNPTAARAEREEDGLALIELAQQFDPRLPDPRVYLAMIAIERGDPATARAHLERVLRLQRGHARARALLESLGG